MSFYPLKYKMPILCYLLVLLNIELNAFAKENKLVDNIDVESQKRIFNKQNNFKILIYDETSGFTHNSRDDARIMFEELGDQHGFEVVFDRSGDAFNSLENLQNFAIVVFSNTSGNEILNEDQKSNFEEYIRSGGTFLGIHAATDTYRSGWNWYRDLVGGSVRTNPNHTDQNFPGTMDVLDSDHPATSNVPDPWSRNEEWYYWKGGGGYLFSGNINLLQLRATGDNDYDEARPVSWYKEYDGGKSFYTAMGHAGSVYSEEHFRNHIVGAIDWLTEEINNEPEPPTLDPIENPEPVSENSGVQTITLTGISAGSGNIENLSISAISNNPELIPTPQIEYESPSTTATLSFQPVPQKSGTAEITITLDNGEENNNSTTRSFTITVLSEDQPLTISEIEDQVITINEEIDPITFFINYEGNDEISISVSSDNEELIPNENIVIEGDNSERTINLTPIVGQSGIANILIIVSAGEYEAESQFQVEIQNVTTTTENNPEYLILYPNPAENEIFLNLKKGNYKILLHDVRGKKLFEIISQQILPDIPFSISLDQIEPGVYILLITRNNNTIRKKLIKR